jgi:hypothetical protein
VGQLKGTPRRKVGLTDSQLRRIRRDIVEEMLIEMAEGILSRKRSTADLLRDLISRLKEGVER